MNYDVIIIGGGQAVEPSRDISHLRARKSSCWNGEIRLKREKETGAPMPCFVDNRYISPDTWYDKSRKAFQPQVHYFVGGATKMYGAALYRLRKEDFGELKHYDGAYHLHGRSLMKRWSLTTRKPNEMYQVHGQARHRSHRASLQAPRIRSRPSLNEPRIQKLYDDLKKPAITPFPAPCGVLMNEKDMAFGKCVRCNTCDGFPCLVQAKSDAEDDWRTPCSRIPERDTCNQCKGPSN